MPVDPSGTLRLVLNRLQKEQARIEQQIAGLRLAISAGGGDADGIPVQRPRTAQRKSRRMTTTARKAQSDRMKRYWAKRRRMRGKRKQRAT
jgi:hypothetical protein